jgi:hypothetical protein
MRRCREQDTSSCSKRCCPFSGSSLASAASTSLAVADSELQRPPSLTCIAHCSGRPFSAAISPATPSACPLGLHGGGRIRLGALVFHHCNSSYHKHFTPSRPSFSRIPADAFFQVRSDSHLSRRGVSHYEVIHIAQFFAGKRLFFAPDESMCSPLNETQFLLCNVHALKLTQSLCTWYRAGEDGSVPQALIKLEYKSKNRRCTVR